LRIPFSIGRNIVSELAAKKYPLHDSTVPPRGIGAILICNPAVLPVPPSLILVQAMYISLRANCLTSDRELREAFQKPLCVIPLLHVFATNTSMLLRPCGPRRLKKLLGLRIAEEGGSMDLLPSSLWTARAPAVFIRRRLLGRSQNVNRRAPKGFTGADTESALTIAKACLPVERVFQFRGLRHVRGPVDAPSPAMSCSCPA